MAFSLRSNGKVRYSPNEQRLFALLPQDGRPIDSAVLTSQLYANATEPFNSRKAVISTIRSLTEKVIRNGEPFRIIKSGRMGPAPMEFRIESARARATA